MLRSADMGRTRRRAVKGRERPPPIKTAHLGDDVASSDEGEQWSDDNDDMDTTGGSRESRSSGSESSSSGSESSGGNSSGSGSFEESDDQEYSEGTPMSSPHSGTSHSSCTSSSFSPMSIGADTHRHRHHLFPHSASTASSPRRFFDPRGMYMTLTHRMVIRMFEYHDVDLETCFDDPAWSDLIVTRVEDGEKVVLDLVEEYMGVDSHLLTLAIMCLKLSLRASRSVCTVSEEYSADDITDIARRLLKVYAMPRRRRRHEIEEEDDIAQTDFAVSHLLQVLGQTPYILNERINI